jgi:primary-amine oxidase
LESRNGTLVHPLKDQAGDYEFEDNGVKENFHCLPDAPANFEYSEIGVDGVDGFLDV